MLKKIKKYNHLNRLVTLSPLTDMATKFHERNGAKLIQKGVHGDTHAAKKWISVIKNKGRWITNAP